MKQSGADVRQAARRGTLGGHTAGLAPGLLQANLVILPAALAFDFLRFCQRNPRPCPLLAVGEPGDPALTALGHDIDLRYDVPAYRVFRRDQGFEPVADIASLWRDDLVSFALGCSFSFEQSLIDEGIAVRHIDAGRNVPMYRTGIDCAPAGAFGGPLVVSMRAFSSADAIRATLLSDRQPLAHGAPVHIGDPAAIGIADIDAPDFGDPPAIEAGDVPVFWACGVTPQLALEAASPDLAITHAPGCMLVTDVPAADAQRRLFDPLAHPIDRPLAGPIDRSANEPHLPSHQRQR